MRSKEAPREAQGNRRRGYKPKEDSRLSERLVDLIAPYREEGLARERYEALIAAAATAWNLSFLPETERLPAMSDALRRAKGPGAGDAAEIVLALIRRKEELFPDDDRTIVDWEVSESDDHCHLTVLSSGA